MSMRTESDGDKSIIYLVDRIDSVNAEEVKRELSDYVDEHKGSEIILDADELKYISSAGLRVLMFINKKAGSSLTVRNVSMEVYEILDMTKFTSFLNIKKKMRSISIDGCEVIGKGAVGTVYRIDDDTIVKVYDNHCNLELIENEQNMAKQAFLMGIPTAISFDIVKVGDRYGSVFELLRAKTYNDLIIEHPEQIEENVRKYAEFIRQVHSIEVEKGQLPEAKDKFIRYLDDIKQFIPDDISIKLKEFFDTMPEELHVVHGDIQMKNVMLSGDEPLLIDMDTLAVGDPIFDLMGLYVTYVLFNEDEPDNTEKFLGISSDTSDYIWENTFKCYYEGADKAETEEAMRKIIITGSVRFLHIICGMNVGREDLKQIRIEHTISHLREQFAQ